MVEKIEKYRDKFGREYNTEAEALKGEVKTNLYNLLEKLVNRKKDYYSSREIDIWDITEAFVKKRPELAMYIIERLK